MKKTDRFIILTMLSACLASFAIGIRTRETEKGTALCINEIMGRSSEFLVDPATYSKQWIELYNGTGQDIDLTGYGLSTIKERPYQIRFDHVTIPSEGFLVVLALGEDGPGTPFLSAADELRTDLDINADGGRLFLTDAGGELVDAVTYGDCVADVAYGRSPDGGELVLFKQSTRGTSNGANISRKIPSVSFDHTAVFSHEEGVYPEAFDLELSALPGESVFYTLDGSDPDIYSNVYKEPIRIYDRSNEQNRYAGISTEAGSIKRKYGQQPVKKATVVRTRLFRDGQLSDAITSKTYWIGEASGLLTVSLVTDPDNLFDYRDGILVPGMMYAYYVRGNNTTNRQIGNYSLRGAMSVREASISFFEDGKPINQHNGGVRVGAGLHNAWRGPVKRLYLSSSLLHEPDGAAFPESLIADDGAEKRGLPVLRLRSSVNFTENGITDVFVNRVIEGEGLGEQKSRPVSVYIDGEYWGVSYLTEAFDEEFVSRHFQLEEGNISLLKLDIVSQEYEIEAGGEEMKEDYLDLLQYGAGHDLSEPEYYDNICQRLDIDNYIKNYVIRMFFASKDWPDNNIRAFRAVEPDGTLNGDGKWRYLMFDNDYTCMDYQFNMAVYVMGEEKRQGLYDNSRPAEGTYELFVSLMENKTFRDRLKMQYEEYKKTIFDQEYMQEILDGMLEELGPEFAESAKRWTSTPSIIGKTADILGLDSGTVNQRRVEENCIQQMEAFIREREGYMDAHLEALFARYED